jgi:hypothetical protein
MLKQRWEVYGMIIEVEDRKNEILCERQFMKLKLQLSKE